MLATYSQIVQKIKKTFVLSCNYSVNLRLFQSKIKHLCACTHTFLSSARNLSNLSEFILKQAFNLGSSSFLLL